MTFSRRQRGSVIIFAVLLMASILAIMLALVGVFVPKLKVILEAGNSTGAVFAADAAAEACLYEARQQPATPLPRPILTNGATFTIASLSASPVDITNDCRPIGATYFRFRAVGTYNGVSRAIEVTQ